MSVDESVVRDLKFLLKTYDGIVKMMTSSKNRLKAINPGAKAKHQKEIQWMEKQKNRLKYKIKKELIYWPIWTEWMQDLPGIGEFLGGNLIILYYYRFIPICQNCDGLLVKKDNGKKDKKKIFVCKVCGKKAKGDGVLKYRIEDKDFRHVSAWWKYLGEDNDPETGRMRRKKKGGDDEDNKWSHWGRRISWGIGESFNHCKAEKGHLYKAYYEQLKNKGKKHGDAIRRTRKLFLSHFWHVARTLDGKSTEGPYAEVILKHTGIIAPYYWESDT